MNSAWGVVAIAMAALMITLGPTAYAFGLFVLPVSEEFGLGRASMNTGLIAFNFGMALSSPVIGRLIDRYPVRRVMAICAVLFGGSLVLLGLSHNAVFSAFVLGVPLAAGAVGAGILTAPALVARSFTAGRARAMAIAAIGISLGSIVIVPAVAILIQWVGWRTTLVIEGVVLGALLLALSALAPQAMRCSSFDGEAAGTGRAGPVRAPKPVPLLKTVAFWQVAIGTALGLGVLQTLLVSLVPIARETGFSVSEAGSLLSLFGGFALVGKLVLAWLANRMEMRVILASLFTAIGALCMLLLLTEGSYALLIMTALLGLVAGVSTPAYQALLADLFGQASFGSANGAAMLVIACTGALLMRLGGEIFDRSASYDAMFMVFAAISLVSTGLLVSLAAPASKVGQPAVPQAAEHG